MIENALSPMPAIIERLRTECPDFEQVMDAADAARIKVAQMRTPNAQVLYQGFIVPGGERFRAGQGKGQVITQRWLIWIAVKNASDQVRKQDSLLAAGALFIAVFRALGGWTPIVGAKPLALATPPSPMYDAAYAYIPIAFEGDLILTVE